MTETNALAKLVAAAGIEDTCRKCGSPVRKIAMRGRGVGPRGTYPVDLFNSDGTSHWGTCGKEVR